jgi:hypothetical protein
MINNHIKSWNTNTTVNRVGTAYHGFFMEKKGDSTCPERLVNRIVTNTETKNKEENI